MDTGSIDLHVHSTYSDGTLTPEELVREALFLGLSALALTDHDCVGGIDRARKAAGGSDLEIISGIELSCEHEDKEIHLIGLFIDEKNAQLSQKLNDFRNSRDNRNRRMVEKLRCEAAFDIDYEQLLQEYPDSVITRAHIARYLAEHHLVKDRDTVFRRYIGDGCPYYVPRPKITPQEGIRLIHDAGGAAFLAHPILYHMNTARLYDLTGMLAKSGLDGIEAVYSAYQPGDEQNMKKIAAKYRLLISGGSDFHGANKPYIRLGCGTGHMPIPADILTDIRRTVS